MGKRGNQPCDARYIPYQWSGRADSANRWMLTGFMYDRLVNANPSYLVFIWIVYAIYGVPELSTSSLGLPSLPSQPACTWHGLAATSRLASLAFTILPTKPKKLCTSLCGPHAKACPYRVLALATTMHRLSGDTSVGSMSSMHNHSCDVCLLLKVGDYI